MERVKSRLLLALAALVLVVLAVLLVIETRARPPVSEAPAPSPIAAMPAPPPPSVPTQPRPQPAPTRTPDAAALGPPRHALVHGELPYPPPVFADARDRDRFKRWWVAEMVRRADVLRRLEPDRRYPSDGEVERMMDRLYDLAEPPPEFGEREVMAQAADRQQQYFQLANHDFVAAFGVSAMDLVRRGGDPKFGSASDPPVLPPDWKGP